MSTPVRKVGPFTLVARRRAAHSSRGYRLINYIIYLYNINVTPIKITNGVSDNSLHRITFGYLVASSGRLLFWRGYQLRLL